MRTFDHIVNWKLLSGSHDFPGPQGGTCINEAAIVAAGFEYKKISSAKDCPPCFSRPIAQYAIRLNDSMPDDMRQELLMPFVMRLSGTSDTPAMERKRADFMVIQTFKRILPIVCRKRLKREDLALRCEAVGTLNECREAAQLIRAAAYAAAAAYADAAADAAAADAAAADAAAAYAAADAAAAYAAAYAAAAADAAAAAAAAAAYADDDARKEIYTIACEILDGAILMGRHTELDICEVAPRLEKAKAERTKICA